MVPPNTRRLSRTSFSSFPLASFPASSSASCTVYLSFSAFLRLNPFVDSSNLQLRARFKASFLSYSLAEKASLLLIVLNQDIELRASFKASLF